jgi:Tol biopolymer transport system component
MLVVCLLLVPGVAAQQATPEASSPQHYAVGERTRLLELSPSGEFVAGINDDEELCTFAVPSGDEIACADVQQQNISVDFESISWAPDSSAFAFTVPAFAYFIDGDIWRFEAQSGELTNLTDDNFEGGLPLTGDLEAGQIINVDVAPAWSPDGKTIAFSRSIVTAETGLDGPNELWSVDVASGDAKKIATVDERRTGVLYYGVVWSPDSGTIYATYDIFNDVDPNDDASGVHAIDVATGTDSLIAGRQADFDNDVPTVIDISPDGKTLVVCFAAYLGSSGMPAGGGYALLSIETGELTRVDPPADTDPNQAVAIAPAFTKDGKSLVYSVMRLTAPGGLIVSRDLASGSEEVIATLPDGALPVAIARNQPLGIGANGLALVMVNPFEAYLVSVSGSTESRSGHAEVTLPTPDVEG